jgi:glycosyltransferase
MSELKISIVTISFNNARDIRQTIESVVKQSYENIEYIIIDGGSKDDTLNIVQEYKSRLAKVISEPDRNMYDAINKGLKLASGDIVGLIHAGDRLFNSEIITKIADHFNENDIDIMYGNSILVNKKDVPVRINKSPEFTRGLVKRGWMPSHQSIYIKRKLLEEIGYYNLDLHPSSDYEFFLRYFYFSNLRIKRLNEFVLRFSMGGRSTRNYMNNLKCQKQHILCWKVNGENPPFYLVPLKLLRKPRQFLIADIYRITGKYKKL